MATGYEKMSEQRAREELARQHRYENDPRRDEFGREAPDRYGLPASGPYVPPPYPEAWYAPFGPFHPFWSRRHLQGPGMDPRSRNLNERDFFDRAADEVASWFGDDAAEARRDVDHRGRGPKGYVRSDTRIEEDVHDRLTDDPALDATEIEVAVKNREVTLNGTVESRRDKRRAEDCVDSVSGVVHVQNNLRVAQTA